MPGSWRGQMAGIPMDAVKRDYVKRSLSKLLEKADGDHFRFNDLFLEDSKILFTEKDELYSTINPSFKALIKDGAIEICLSPNDTKYSKKLYKLKSKHSLLNYLSRFNNNDQAIKYGSGREFEMKPELKNFLDGLLLGDACYKIKKLKNGQRGMSATLHISQRWDHEDWLIEIREKLKKFGVGCRKFCYEPGRWKTIAGKKTWAEPSVALATVTYRNFEKEHSRWYREGVDKNGKFKWIKIVPRDVDLASPDLLAQWYMGDGSIYSSRIRLHTNGFAWIEAEFLSKLFLEKLNLTCYINKSKEKYPVLELCRQKQAGIFISMISKYVVKSFRYKLG